MGTSRRDILGIDDLRMRTTALPNPLAIREQALSGTGPAELVHQAQRLFRLRDDPRPDPHVVTVDDITAGLGLHDADRAMLERAVSEPSTEHQPRGGYKLNGARTYLASVLSGMKDRVGSDVRTEVMRRALTWWRKNGMTEPARRPELRIGKKAMVYTLQKALFTKKDDDDDGDQRPDDRDQPSNGKPGEDKFKPGDQGKEGSKLKPGDDKSNGKDPQALKDRATHFEFNGDSLKLHPDVEVNMPDDADFHHHAREHAKHAVAYAHLKDSDPERARAHMLAANAHAKLGNAMHAAGEQFPGSQQQQPEMDPFMMGQGAGPMGMAPMMGGGPQGPPVGPSGGKDIQGKPQPPGPDAQRNPPGRDSDLQAQRRLTGRDEQGSVSDPSKDRSQQASQPGQQAPGQRRNFFDKSTLYVFPLDVLRKAEGGAGFHKYVSKETVGGKTVYHYQHTGTGERVAKHPIDHLHEVMRPLRSFGNTSKDKTPHPAAVREALRGVKDHAEEKGNKKGALEAIRGYQKDARVHYRNMDQVRRKHEYSPPKDASRTVGHEHANAARSVRDHLEDARAEIASRGKDPKKEAAKQEANAQKYSERKGHDLAERHALHVGSAKASLRREMEQHFAEHQKRFGVPHPAAKAHDAETKERHERQGGPDISTQEFNAAADSSEGVKIRQAVAKRHAELINAGADEGVSKKHAQQDFSDAIHRLHHRTKKEQESGQQTMFRSTGMTVMTLRK